jgi:hypothetical protein
LLEFTPAQIPDEAFVRCPKTPKFDLVQVREHCPACEHWGGYTEDASAGETPERYGTACAFPVARWWKKILIARPKEK